MTAKPAGAPAPTAAAEPFFPGQASSVALMLSGMFRERLVAIEGSPPFNSPPNAQSWEGTPMLFLLLGESTVQITFVCGPVVDIPTSHESPVAIQYDHAGGRATVLRNGETVLALTRVGEPAPNNFRPRS